ncbi:dipeptidyl peptidase IV N-terminal region-domain-containing protein [Aspergillus crustosus]
MGTSGDHEDSELLPMNRRRSSTAASDTSTDSGLSVDSVFLQESKFNAPTDTLGGSADTRYRDEEDRDSEPNESLLRTKSTSSTRSRRLIWALILLCFGGWVLAFVLFITQGRSNYQTASDVLQSHEPSPFSGSTSSGKPITLDQVLTGAFSPRGHAISWVAGPDGEDGLLIERGESEGEGYLRVNDIRSQDGETNRILMQNSTVEVGKRSVSPTAVRPSPDMKKVLLTSHQEKNWRHSYTGRYWIFDVETQTAEPLDPDNIEGRVQLALWSPKSDSISFVRDNNLYLRKLSSKKVVTITKDGGEQLFYGVPDWVYEEEVFSGNSVTWWSEDGSKIAFIRTNESAVPEFPVQYFLSRPSGKNPAPGLENYPEVREIKYPKAGAPNPFVSLQFYDVEKAEVFTVDTPEDFGDDDRLIIEVVWATGNVLVRTTNRESDTFKIFLIDTNERNSTLIRIQDVSELDGGWVEPTQSTRFIPADPENGRPHDGYLDTVIYEGFDHLAYFTPLDNPEPILLTSGEWEVVDAPTAVDLTRGLVYFIATKESPTQRHLYRVQLDGTNLQPLTDTSKPGYYGVSFSEGTGYALLSYKGPSVPWQSIISTTEGDKPTTLKTIEDNAKLARLVEEYSLPTEIYQNITIDGFTLQVVERLPPHFNPAKKYPVLFHLYGGPGSQTVDRKFTVDFQAYVAATLGYIVVTVDGRGTGFIGRKARCIIRGDIGYYEAVDQIETAKHWAKKPYVDESRIAIWGWSYGGFMTLKTLEQDAGETFQYGMAVAPVTDWRFYDSVYTERYMHTPQHNPKGYDNTSISDMSALQNAVRFLVIHGASDDNVHIQNTLTLIDKLDLSSVQNYDVHFYPDSDHSIYFHNAHAMVYERMSLNFLLELFVAFTSSMNN